MEVRQIFTQSALPTTTRTTSRMTARLKNWKNREKEKYEKNKCKFALVPGDHLTKLNETKLNLTVETYDTIGFQTPH